MPAPVLLLADESSTTKRVVELSFEETGLQIVTVRDGDEALAWLSRERPAIVLADIALPRRSGYEVAAAAKALPGAPVVPVVLLAGALEPFDQDKVLECRCDTVLRKPFDPRVLAARVRDLLAVAASTVVAPQIAPPAAGESKPAPDAFDDVVEETEEVEDVSEFEDEGVEIELDADLASVPTLSDVLGDQSVGGEDDVFSLDEALLFSDRDLAETLGTHAPDQAVSPVQTPPSTSVTLRVADTHATFDTKGPSESEAIEPETSSPVELPVRASITVERPAISAPAAATPATRQPAHASLAEAFTSLLAVEQHETDTVPIGVYSLATSVRTEQLVEEITRRVLERLKREL